MEEREGERREREGGKEGRKKGERGRERWKKGRERGGGDGRKEGERGRERGKKERVRTKFHLVHVDSERLDEDKATQYITHLKAVEIRWDLDPTLCSRQMLYQLSYHGNSAG